MAKRGATTDLNHDNWDREEPPETAGTFQKASLDMMERRVIKVAKRRSATGSADQGLQKNVFSSFQGFKSDTTPNLNTDAKTTFSFLNSMSTPVNGLQENQSSLNATTVSSSTNILNKSPANMNDSKSDKKYPAKLIRLNQCVANWIKSHVDKDPSCILTPIFKDYERYLKDIEEESNTSLTSEKNDLKDTTSSSNSKSNSLISSSSSNVTTSNFKFNQPSNNISSSNSTSKSDSPFSGTGPFSTSPSHSVFSSFKTDNSLVKASGGINALLAKPDAASLKVNPFTTILNKSPSADSDKSKSDVTFKLPQKVTEASGFSFSSQVFGNTAKAGTAPSILGGSSTTTSDNKTNENEGEAEDSDEPPKVEFTPVQENDSVFNKRCKVFLKKENNYVELGVGTLFVKPVTGSKHQLIVRADTSLGNILVNVLLTPTIPIQRMGKNNVMVICVRIPPATGSDSPPAASTILLRVKTAGEADELLKVLEKYKQI